MNDQIYIHYGSKIFNPKLNFPIRNRNYPSVKPYGGLWGSRIGASFGWKDWCKEEDFRDCDPLDSFQFKLKPEAINYIISKTEDLYALPNLKFDKYKYIKDYYIDFEKCLSLGIDSIELCWYGEEYKYVRNGNLHYDLYGWDCDSIVILNPDAIVIMEH